MTLGRAVAGLTAYSKGKPLGIFEPRPEAVREKCGEMWRKAGAVTIALVGHGVPTANLRRRRTRLLLAQNADHLLHAEPAFPHRPCPVDGRSIQLTQPEGKESAGNRVTSNGR